MSASVYQLEEQQAAERRVREAEKALAKARLNLECTEHDYTGGRMHPQLSTLPQYTYAQPA